MFDNHDVLISLEERHAENIIRGTKLVELRRRRMNVPVGAVVWMYVKSPTAAVIGRASVSEVHSLAPRTLWQRFSNTCGLTRVEFFSYFSGTTKGFALSLSNVERLTDPVSLGQLRQSGSQFHPPQFFMRLKQGSALLKRLKAD